MVKIRTQNINQHFVVHVISILWCQQIISLFSASPRYYQSGIMDLYDIICQWLNIPDNCPSPYRFPHQTKLHWTNFPLTKFLVGHNYCHQAIISALLSDKKTFPWRSEQTIDHFNVFKIHTVEGLVPIFVPWLNFGHLE